MPTALISVYDKSGIADFARLLVSQNWNILASGGTAKYLHELAIPVTEISTYTGSPEILGGRVKTLHPAIHAGILARPTEKDLTELANQNWQPIDMVIVNLYPFQKVISDPQTTMEDAIENIDIGGVTLIRAAAKNWQRVTLLCDPEDYQIIAQEMVNGQISESTRRSMAQKGFSLTAQYDRAISGYFSSNPSTQLELFQIQSLRYGENPHQSAHLFSFTAGEGPLGGTLLQGKELSYNNLLDLDSAWRAVVQFQEPTVVIVKHNSPCGIASSSSLESAYRAALASDPVSAFGSVIACNQPLDEATSVAMQDLFIECIIAPQFTPRARMILSAKKNCRLIQMPNLDVKPPFEMRTIVRGVLRQSLDDGDPDEKTWRVVSNREPSPSEWRSLRFAWKACQFVKSNAIVLAQETATVGIGGGQPNRVDSVRIALQRAGDRSKGAVMASDAFFPFPDSITLAAQGGVTAVIHPGGSQRDAESIQMADHYDLAMVTTGRRHFRH